MLSVSHYEGVSFASGEAVGYQPEFQSSTSEIISINDVWRAATRIAPYIKRTPTLVDTFLCDHPPNLPGKTQSFR